MAKMEYGQPFIEKNCRFYGKTRILRPHLIKMSKKILHVEGLPVTVDQVGDTDFLSLTDIAKKAADEPRFVVRNWLSTQNTVAYLGEWEAIHNPDFNRAGFRTFKDDFFEKPFSLTPSRWIELTSAIGLRTAAGRHGGGTFAHRDIALNFCFWLSPSFQIYLLKEFQRLKDAEQRQRGWLTDRVSGLLDETKNWVEMLKNEA